MMARLPDFTAAITQVVVGAGQLPNRGKTHPRGPIGAQAYTRNMLAGLATLTDRHVPDGQIEPRHIDNRSGTIRLPAAGLSFLVHGGHRR